MSRKGTAAPPAKKGAVKGKGVELDDQLTQCQEILDSIMSKPEAGDFCEPVDWEKLGLTDYPELITHPMDLGTIKNKLLGGKYPTADRFAADMKLVWKNAMTYNRSDSEIYRTADKFSKTFEKKFATMRKPAAAASASAAAVGAPSTAVPAGTKRRKTDKADAGVKVSKEDRIKFSQLINMLKANELGQLVDIIAKDCPEALNEEDEDELEIELNQIGPDVLGKLRSFAESCISEYGHKTEE